MRNKIILGVVVLVLINLFFGENSNKIDIVKNTVIMDTDTVTIGDVLDSTDINIYGFGTYNTEWSFFETEQNKKVVQAELIANLTLKEKLEGIKDKRIVYQFIVDEKDSIKLDNIVIDATGINGEHIKRGGKSGNNSISKTFKEMYRMYKINNRKIGLQKK